MAGTFGRGIIASILPALSGGAECSCHQVGGGILMPFGARRRLGRLRHALTRGLIVQ